MKDSELWEEYMEEFTSWLDEQIRNYELKIEFLKGIKNKCCPEKEEEK